MEDDHIDNKKINHFSPVNNSLQPIKTLAGTIWGITTFFNPAMYSNKIKNYRIFRERSKKQGLKLLVVELAYGHNPFELEEDDAEILVKLRSVKNNFIWQKEAMLNIALKNLPPDCDKIVWVDCDIIFKNDNWIHETVRLLNKYKVVQPYQYSIRLEKNSNINGSHNELDARIGRGAYMALPENQRHKSHQLGHPGFAWAARRKIMEDNGFFDRTIISSADDIMSYSFFNNEENIKEKHLSPKMFSDVLSWKQKIFDEVRGSVYYCSGDILHLWHGDYKDRSYGKITNEIIRKYDFDPSTDIKKDENGIWVWSSHKPEMHHEMEKYFFARNEDGKRQKYNQVMTDGQAQITIFTIPKPFIGHIGTIQENAIKSWLALKPQPEIILFGDEIGISEIAEKYKVRHVKNIKRNNLNTPLLNYVFQKAKKLSSKYFLCYVNADIILYQRMINTVDFVSSDFDKFLMSAKRVDIEYNNVIDLTKKDWLDEVLNCTSTKGTMRNDFYLDLFIYPKKINIKMPPFAVGRPYWDPWVLSYFKKNHIPIIDATEQFIVIHQNHDYSHVKDRIGDTWHGPEGENNFRLAGLKKNQTSLYSLKDADVILPDKLDFSRNKIKKTNIEKYSENMLSMIDRNRRKLIGGVGIILKSISPRFYEKLKANKPRWLC